MCIVLLLPTLLDNTRLCLTKKVIQVDIRKTGKFPILYYVRPFNKCAFQGKASPFLVLPGAGYWL